MDKIIREIGEKFKKYHIFKGSVMFDEPLSRHTTMKVGGNAVVFVEPENEVSTAFVFALCRKYNVKVFVLGGGSNLVFSDSGFNGVVLSTKALSSISFTSVSDSLSVLMTCGSGTRNSEISDFCMKKGFTGMESFAGLPGTSGGGAFMNARCYDTSISDVFVGAEYLNLEKIEPLSDDEEVSVLNDETEGLEKKLLKSAEKYVMNENDWEYKKSPFMMGTRLLTKITYRLLATDSQVLENGMDACEEARKAVQLKNQYYIQERIGKGHFKAPSAGSVFKNNRDFGKPSGKLIDEAGLKGTECGGAQIAPWHGNFIINNGKATSEDIRSLVRLAQDKVKEQTGFFMEPEIIFVD